MPREERAMGVWLRGCSQVYKMRRGFPQATLVRVCSREPKPQATQDSGLCGPSSGEAMDSPGGGGLQHQRPAAVARDERPGVGLLADGQARWVEAWGGGRGDNHL